MTFEEAQRALKWLDQREAEIRAEFAERPEELEEQLKPVLSLKSTTKAHLKTQVN
jgi:hypothetical protein